MSNGTEFKATDVIHKRRRKDKKESDYVVEIETVFVMYYGAVYWNGKYEC